MAPGHNKKFLRKQKLGKRGPKKFEENWQSMQRLSTTDPVLHYMQSMSKVIELGHMPDAYLPRATHEDIVEDVRRRIFDAMSQLFGGRYYQFLHSIGFTVTTAQHVRGKVTNNQTPLHLRIGIAMMLAHISGIREHLIDVERDLWIALQQSHDPRLCTWEDYMDRRRAAYDKHIAPDAKPIFLPIRPLATIAQAKGTPRSNFIRDKLIKQARPWYNVRVKQKDAKPPEELHDDILESSIELMKWNYVRHILKIGKFVKMHPDLVHSVLKKEEKRLGSYEALVKAVKAANQGRAHHRRFRIRSSKEPIRSYRQEKEYKKWIAEEGAHHRVDEERDYKAWLAEKEAILAAQKKAEEEEGEE